MANENDLIRRGDLKDLLIKRSFYPAIVAAALKEIPKADAVEVVRCKDCAVPHNKWTGCPKLSGLVPPPDFYCAYGERKDNAID